MTTVRVNIVNHNIGGGTTYGTGLYSDGIAPTGTVLRIVQSTESSSPDQIDAVTLQECLRSEFEYWTNVRGWYGVFSIMTTADENKFRGNQDKGQAILSRYPILDSHVEFLGVPANVVTQKDFTLLSVKIDHPGFRNVVDKLWVSTTHLWSAGLDPYGVEYDGNTNDSVRNFQAGKVSDYLSIRTQWAQKHILTGDFNTGPKTFAIDYIHRVNRDGSVGTAKFWEGDQSHGISGLQRAGRDTSTGRKIDYFFASFQGANSLEAGIDMELVTASENGGDKHLMILHGKAIWADVQ